jgi:toxin ParE1/3/4
MKRYRLNSTAKSDLTSIHKYNARDNLAAADRMILTLKQKFRLLASQPLLGQNRPELGVNLRSFTEGNYVIFYRSVKNSIEIARAIHAARDIDIQF